MASEGERLAADDADGGDSEEPVCATAIFGLGHAHVIPH